jgi:tetratricopeptide (TPR) repeat protein
MLSFFSRLFLPLLLLLLAVASCGTSKKATRCDNELPARQPLTSAEKHLFNVLYHEALISLERNEFDAHKVLLERALEIDSTAAEALWLLARAQYAFAGRMDTVQRQIALKNMRSAAYYCPNDVDIQENLAVMLDYEGRHEEALACYKQLVDIHPAKASQLKLAESYMRLGKFQDALGVFNQIERQSGLIREVIAGKLEVYSELRDSLPLFAFVDTLISEHPNDYEYQIFKGDCYATMYNRPDLAFSIYNDVLSQSPSNQRAQYALLSYYIEAGDRNKMFDAIKRIVSNEHIEEFNRAELVIDFMQDCIQNDTTRLFELREFLDTLSHPENATGALSAAHVGLLSLLKATPDSVITAVHRTLSFQPENSVIRRQGMYQYYLSNNMEGLLNLCEEGQYYDPSTIEYYYFPADYARYNGEDEKALEILERGVPYYVKSKNDTLATDIYAMMGDLYHQQGELERCFEAYDSALVIVPDNPLVLNNYAYFLSLEELDLEKAITMAHRANELAPNNPTYLDTYAWVLYQAGQYTQAQIYIDQALAALTEKEESSVYYKHAGDIYWKLGDRKSARKFWKRAEELKKAGKE